MENNKHNQQIIEQFTSQAAGYTAIASHSDALDKLIEIIRPDKDDTVLDVACGSGIVSLAFARHVKEVTGIDLTAAMLKQAKMQQERSGLDNISWMIGDADALPFSDSSFSIVVTRFSFHHFLDPKAVLKEMIRVCKPGGSIMVTDVAVSEVFANKYDQMEKIRDNSHNKVLSPAGLYQLFESCNLINIQKDSYHMEIGLEEQLQASYSTDKAVLKEMILQGFESQDLGVTVTKIGEEYNIIYPIHIIAGNKA